MHLTCILLPIAKSALQPSAFSFPFGKRGFCEVQKPILGSVKGGFVNFNPYLCRHFKPSKTTIDMDDRDLVAALLRHDPFVTKLFFYRNCRPLFTSLTASFADGSRRWEYNELVSEIYALLMENDGRRLRTFKFDCSIYQWLKVITRNFMLAHTDVVIDNRSHMPLYERAGTCAGTDESGSMQMAPSTPLAPDTGGEASVDLERLLDAMPHRRYAEVLRKAIVEGYTNEELAREMNIKISNLYNIKRRAMTMLCEVIQKDKELYLARRTAREGTATRRNGTRS